MNPPSNEPVDTTPLFNSSTNTCYNPSSFNGGGGGGGGTPSPSASPTGGGGGGGGGSCSTAWNSSTSYVPGNNVSYNHENYTAIYWSTGVTPGSAIAWNIWKPVASC